MRRFAPLVGRVLVLLMILCGMASAQRHSMGVAPPTGPIPIPPRLATPVPLVRQLPVATVHTATVPAGPVAAVSTGMGAIQFVTSGAAVPAPQTLTRQLSAEDERARLGALASLGAPGEYLAHGHVPFPHSVQLDMVQLGTSEELDALLTVELDGHVVSAVLVPEGGNWRRVATLSFASSFSSGTTTPSNFVRPLRSWLAPDRYRAVYHATVNGPNGDFTENEADLRVINGRATVVISFVSGARQCDATGQLRPPHQTCELIQRWVEPDAADPNHHLTLITGMGHISAHEAEDPLSRSRNYRLTRLRSFACQPFRFAEGASRFEPLTNSSPCVAHETGGPARAEHPAAEHGVPEHPAVEHPAVEHPAVEHPAVEHTAVEHGAVEHGEHP